MTKLNIEYIEYIDNDFDNRKHILVNGTNYCKDSFCFGNRILYLHDEELFNVLCEYKIIDLFSYFMRINITIEMADDRWLDIVLSSGKHPLNKESKVYASINYNLEDWNKPWSVNQYFYSLLKKIETIPDLETSCSIDFEDKDEVTGEPIYNLLNGIGIGFPISTPSISLKSIYNQAKGLCLSIHKQVEDELSFSLNQHKVERSIHFAPEYHQAGLGILNFFGAYLREQYPEENASVRIEQYGLQVKMVIESVDGKTEIIEKALHEYELIIKGEESAEKFSNNDVFILELKNELRVAQVRIESQKDLIGLQDGRIEKLLNILGDGLSQKHQISVEVKPNISISSTITINQDIAATLSNINELINEIPKSSDAYSLLNQLKNSLTEIESNNDPETVRQSPAMSKLKRFITKATDSSSNLNMVINKAESGWEILSELAEKYNKLAEWCCLPTVPSALIK